MADSFILSEMGPGAPRLLPHGPLAAIPGEQMTVEKCLDGCAAAGYNAAGLEAGQVIQTRRLLENTSNLPILF